MSDLQQNYAGLFDGRLGFGRKPVILVVDFIRAYTTLDSPLFAADVVVAVAATVDLLTAHATKAFPSFTQVLYSASGRDGGIFVQKVPVLRMLVSGEPLAGSCRNCRHSRPMSLLSSNMPALFRHVVSGDVDEHGDRYGYFGRLLDKWLYSRHGSRWDAAWFSCSYTARMCRRSPSRTARVELV